MAIIRVNHTEGFTVMSNYHLRDKNLSLKAKGLLSQMLSLPPEWDYSVSGLAAINQEKSTAIMTALKELKQNGYLTITRLNPDQTESGRFEYVYDVFELPQEKQVIEKQVIEKQEAEKQDIENLCIEILSVENPQQINIDKENKDKSNKEKKIKRNVIPSVEEVKEFCQERKSPIDAEYFWNYYQSQNWKKANGRPLEDWQAAVRQWELKERKTVPKQDRERSFTMEDVQSLFEADLKGAGT